MLIVLQYHLFDFGFTNIIPKSQPLHQSTTLSPLLLLSDIEMLLKSHPQRENNSTLLKKGDFIGQHKKEKNATKK